MVFVVRYCSESSRHRYRKMKMNVDPLHISYRIFILIILVKKL